MIFALGMGLATLVAATPFHDPGRLLGPAQLLEERQSDGGGDLETDAATDPLRDAVKYRNIFSNQATVTYSAVSTGAQPASAKLVATSTVSPGTNGVGSPPDANEQGTGYTVDHILELQFVVGAFQVNPRPTQGSTSIPLDRWNSASIACFTKTNGYAPQISIASAFSGTFNLQGIPSRFNGFKQQVFTGRIKSNPNNPSRNTYPSDFGPALQKFLKDNEQDVYGVVDDVGEALGSNNVGNNSAIKPYFTAYAQNEYRSAIDFLSNWVGTSYTPGGAASTTSSAAGTAVAPKTTTANKPPTKTTKSPIASATTTAKK
ncbi:MAG: hypothetical protein Q9203_006939, partial [Teloschistes exilis]